MSSHDTDAELEVFRTLAGAGLIRAPRLLADIEAEQLYPVEALLARLDDVDEAPSGTPQSDALTLFGGAPSCDAMQHANGHGLRIPAPLKSRMEDVLRVVEQAYREVRGRASTDMILADPSLNAAFIDRCKAVGTYATVLELNTALLYGRKLKKFGPMDRAERFSIPDERLNEFMFASEMALRHIREWQFRQFERKVSLDTILCDPDLVAVFDDIAARLAPGDYSKLEYRWAALRLRKSNRSISALPKLRPDDLEDFGVTRDLHLRQIPKAAGVYCFRCKGKPIYFGQADSLRRQVERHIEAGGFNIVPEWLAETSYQEMRLELVPIPGLSQTRREAVKSLQVDAIMPVFNWLRQHPLFAA